MNEELVVKPLRGRGCIACPDEALFVRSDTNWSSVCDKHLVDWYENQARANPLRLIAVGAYRDMFGDDVDPKALGQMARFMADWSI